jgi:hypothetical protein
MLLRMRPLNRWYVSAPRYLMLYVKSTRQKVLVRQRAASPGLAEAARKSSA